MLTHLIGLADAVGEVSSKRICRGGGAEIGRWCEKEAGEVTCRILKSSYIQRKKCEVTEDRLWVG